MNISFNITLRKNITTSQTSLKLFSLLNTPKTLHKYNVNFLEYFVTIKKEIDYGTNNSYLLINLVFNDMF